MRGALLHAAVSSPSTRFVTLVGWTCRRAPIFPSAARGSAQIQEHQRLVAGERQALRGERIVELGQPDLLDAHHRRDGHHWRDELLVPARAPLTPGLLDRIEAQWLSRGAHLGRESSEPGPNRTREPGREGRQL